jgi:hypothetical protein
MSMAVWFFFFYDFLFLACFLKRVLLVDVLFLAIFFFGKCKPQEQGRISVCVLSELYSPPIGYFGWKGLRGFGRVSSTCMLRSVVFLSATP